MPTVKPIPDGYHAITACFAVSDAAKAIEFYKKAFGAQEVFRMEAPGNKVAHAELQIGDSKIMISDEFMEMGAKSAKTMGGTPVGFYLYVTDCDAMAKQAVAAGAKELMPLQNMFYGDRTGRYEDPFGMIWHISTHIEDPTMEQIRERAAAAMKQHKQKQPA